MADDLMGFTEGNLLLLFDEAGHNAQLFVIDPVAKQQWTASLSSLPTALQEQLKSTNMEFYQSGNYLYLLGGYGYSATLGDHTTFSNLTAVDVPATINAIIANTGFSANLRQITDPQFQVTGGRLEKINNTYYLVGGQKFIGRYNPMGPDHGPGFIQEYTNQIRKFTISDDGTSIKINHLASITDATNLHRRDYNLTAQIMPNGQEGLTAFSGVFQATADLPFLNCVNIDNVQYSVNTAFTQYYNHYQCANFPIYSAKSNEMNTVFFGGIAQYYDNAGILVQDNNVPFVKTIARVSRSTSGTMAEYKLPIEMPALLGAGSEFIPIESLPKYPNGVIKLDVLPMGETLIGYIYGGLSSTDANIFWTNNGTKSNASSQIFKVLLIKNATLGTHDLNEQSTGSLKLMGYQDTNDGNFVVKYNLIKTTDVKLELYSLGGKKIEAKILKNQLAGEKTFEKKIKNIANGGLFILTIETDYEKPYKK
ncbi:MAG: T9SS C-terminal target domain-containing protein [Chitinophagaceae bacterium]|nr:T9SS C-terminal target domain-containing protein [Chitinophagaceae bacterium]